MELEFKSDFEVAREQWVKFWAGENSRPAVSAVLPKPGTNPAAKPEYAAGAREDFDPIIDQLLAWAETHVFLADAIPFFYLEFAADHFAALLGADLKFCDFAPGGWAVPFVRDLAEEEIHFEREGCWWKRTVGSAKVTGCAFCNLNLQWDGYRSKPASQVAAEIDYLTGRYQTLSVAIMDNVLPKKEAANIFKQIAKLDKDLRRLMNPMPAATFETGLFESPRHRIRHEADEIKIARRIGASCVELDCCAADQDWGGVVILEKALDPHNQGGCSVGSLSELEDSFNSHQYNL